MLSIPDQGCHMGHSQQFVRQGNCNCEESVTRTQRRSSYLWPSCRFYGLRLGSFVDLSYQFSWVNHVIPFCRHKQHSTGRDLTQILSNFIHNWCSGLYVLYVHSCHLSFRYDCPLILIPSLLVDGSGYLHYSFTLWLLVVPIILSPARNFNWRHLSGNLSERWVSGTAPLSPDFQISYYTCIGNFTIRLGITVMYKLPPRNGFG